MIRKNLFKQTATLYYPMMLKKLSSLITFLFVANLVFAQGPTPAQIEQFKRMSPQQQRALAESMGIDLDSVLGGMQNSGNANSGNSEAISGKRQAIGDANEAQLDRFGRPIPPTNDRSMLGDIERFSSDGTDAPSLNEDGAPASVSADLTLFGYDIFKYGADAFAPAVDIPIPADYVVGPGDAIAIQLYGKENTSYALTIDRDGKIQFPNIGPVTLAGLSFQGMQDKIAEIVSEQMIGVKSSVTMGSLRTIRIFVLGEAQVAGSYVVGSLSTMTNAIFASGGITKIGSLRNIQLKRKGKTITTLDLYDLLLNGDTSKDARLLPGDVIFIPPIGKTVGVSGAVKRPAIYELKTETSINDAIELAGGLLPTAFLPASRIERITDSGEKTLVNLDISTNAGRNFRLRDADVVQIFSTLDTMRDIVKLEGHVKRPGGFAWRESMHFTDIVPNADDLLPNPDITIGLIQREQPITRKISVRLFSPQAAFKNPGGQGDPFLRPRDTVMLFEYTTDRTTILDDLIKKLKTQSSFNQRQQTVRVFGSVRFPGEYPLSENMTAKDLINIAGGLSESALGSGAEITRYDLSEERERVDLRIDLDLDNENPPLKPADTLRIKQIPQWSDRESVTITGEVNYPGQYDILPGETLLDVINRAGGLTPHGYAEGAIFSRDELRKLETERLETLRNQIEADIAATNIESSSTVDKIDEKQTQQILNNLERTKALGRMVIDLSAILQRPRKYDFELVDGDRLEIPRYKPSVTVLGEIQHPTSHFYNDKLSVTDYIDMSGGTKQNADKKRIYVVKANGRVYTPSSSAWFRSRSQVLEPGDTIIVPIDTDKVDALTLWGSVTTIMYQAALGVAAISSL